MKALRFNKYEIIAFLLGGLIAILLAAPARSAESLRLDPIETHSRDRAVVVEVHTVPEDVFD